VLYLSEFSNLLFGISVRVIADSADFAARAIISRSTSIRFMQHVLQAIHSTRAPVACCKCAEYVSLCLKHWRPHEADRLGDGLDSAIVAAVQSATGDARAAGRKAALLLKTILPDRYRCCFLFCLEHGILSEDFCCRRVWDMVDCSNQKLLAREEQVIPTVLQANETRDILSLGCCCRPRQ
jgi:hypothetical protein